MKQWLCERKGRKKAVAESLNVQTLFKTILVM
jgi:hypothetical protein